MPPDGGGEHDWVQLLVLDAVAGQLWWPVAVKPVTTTVGPEANGPRAVGEQLQIRGWGPVWEQKETAAGPRGGEGLPPLGVEAEALVEVDGVEEAGDCGRQVYHPPQEGAAGWNDLCGKAQCPDEGQEVALAAL